MATIEIKVTQLKKDNPQARQLRRFLEDPWYIQSEIYVGPNAMAAVPEGSIKAYLEKHLEEFGGVDAYIKVEIIPTYNDGVVGNPRSFVSPQEMAEGLERGTIKLLGEISPEQIATLKSGEFPEDFPPRRPDPAS